MAQLPNWQHHSKKDKHGKGTCKGRIRASKQRLRHLKNCHKTSRNGRSFFVYCVQFKEVP
jgi:hypothetical protein